MMLGSALYRLHLVWLAGIALWLPLSYNHTGTLNIPWLSLLVVPAIAAGMMVIRHRREPPGSIRDPSRTSMWDHILELFVFCSVIIGETQAALYLSVPSASPLHCPALRPVFIFAGTGFTILVLIMLHRRQPAHRMALMVTFMSASLFFTQPLDKSPGVILYPLLAVIAGWTAFMRYHDTFHLTKALFPDGISAALAVIMFILMAYNVIRWWRVMPEHFYTDFILVVTGILTWLLFSISLRSDPDAVLRDTAGIHLFITALLAVLFIWRIAGLWMGYGLEFTYIYRAWLADNHPNALAIYLAVSTPLIWLVPHRRIRVPMAVTLFAVMMLIWTMSRNAWLSVLAAGIIGWVIRRPPVSGAHVTIRRHRAGVFIVSMGLVAAAIVYRVSYRFLDLIMVRHRLKLWSLAMQGIRRHLFTGAGIGCHSTSAAFVRNPFDPQMPFIREWFHWDRLGRHFHNVFLEWTWLSGIWGAVLFMLIVILFAQKIGRLKDIRTRRVLLFSGTVFFVSGLFDYVFYYPALFISGAAFLGCLTGLTLTQAVRRIPPMRGMKLRISGISVWLVLFFLEIMVMLLPVRGMHLLAKGDAIGQTGRSSVEAFNAYKAALRFRIAMPDILSRLLSFHVQEKNMAGVQAILTRLVNRPDTDPRYMCILGWLSRGRKTRESFIRQAVSRDPSGLWGMELYSDRAFSACLAGRRGWPSDLKIAVYLDPALPIHLIHAFRRSVNGVVIDTPHWRKYLAARFDMDIFHEAIFPEQFIPVEQLLFEMEAEAERSTEDDAVVLAKRIRLVDAWMKKKDFTTAARLLNKWDIDLSRVVWHGDPVYDYRSDSTGYRVLRGLRAMKDGHEEEALRLFRHAYDHGSRDPRLLFGLGTLFMLREQWTDACRFLEEGIAAAPDMADLYVNLGIVYLRLNREADAERCLEKALRLNPGSEKALLNLGRFYFQTGQVYKALSVITRGHRLYPDNEIMKDLYESCLRRTRIRGLNVSPEPEKTP